MKYALKRLMISFCRTDIFHAVARAAKLLLPYGLFCRLKRRILDIVEEWHDLPVRIPHDFKDVYGARGVNISGYLSSGVGLGESARNLIHALSSQDIRFGLNNFRLQGIKRIKTEFDRSFRRKNPYCFNLVNVNPDHSIFYTIQNSRGYFENKYNIGVWYWETRTLPEEWISYFRFFHEIWAATDFIRDTFSLRAPIPVVKIPTVVRIDPQPITQRHYFNIPEDRFLFLFIFDFNSTTTRKNPQATVRAFKSAFGGEEGVMLCLKTSGGQQFGRELKELYSEIDGARNIMIINEYLDREKLNSLINISDCYVSLHRAEGFGMTIAEAMLLDKPVIVTSYSGNMDFTNNENSLLVDYKLTELERDSGPYRKGAVLAEPDIEHASQFMRWVFEHRDEAGELGIRGAELIRDRYSVQTVGRIIKRRLDSIAGDRAPYR
ncbi:MAG: glycosyltransferase family 4 protein [Spirochaetes bacterium]|nr:glycosyltransferase family 4 protein [Spirochaetota bacterium]